MGFSVRHTELLDPATELEFQRLTRALTEFLAVSMDDDGNLLDAAITLASPDLLDNTLPFVTIGNSASMTNERALTGTSNQVVVTDNGAGTTVQLSTPQNIHTAATPTFAGLTVSALTSGRVTIAGASGVLADDADLTFSGSTLTATNIVGTTSIVTAALTDSGLTSGRVPIAGTGGLLGDDADLTFSGSTLTATNVVGTTSVVSAAITDSGLTATRVTFAGVGGLLSDDADLTFATDTLTATKVVAPTHMVTPLVYGGTAANGDITIDGTSHATKTTSIVILQPTGGGVQIGAAPGTQQLLTLSGAETTGANIWIYNTAGGGFASLATLNNGAGAGQSFNQFISFGTTYAGNRFATLTAAGLNEFSSQGRLVVGTFSAHSLYLGTNNTMRTEMTSAGLLTHAGTIRSTTTATPTAGVGLEMSYVIATGVSNVYSYDRAGSAYKDFNFNDAMYIVGASRVGIGLTGAAITSRLHLPAGTATAGTAPLGFNSGTLLTTAVVGKMEFLTDDYYLTITTGAARKGIVLDDGARLTSGRVPFATTNGRLTDDADMTFATDTLTVTKIGTTTMTGTTTHTGSMIVKSVTDAGPMTATNGTVAEVVYNTSDSKFYGCTVTGTPATWAALN